MKEVKTRKIWTFQLGMGEGINVPVWSIMGFQQQDRQKLNNVTFYRPRVTSTQCIIGTQNCPDSGI